jgi:hypothetical protein
MYEQVTKLLEAELLRSNSEDQILLHDEQHKDDPSISPAAPITRPETSISEKSLPQEEKTLVID